MIHQVIKSSEETIRRYFYYLLLMMIVLRFRLTTYHRKREHFDVNYVLDLNERINEINQSG